MNRVIDYLKNIRKQRYLNLAYKCQYAFVGLGNHSIHNLYPVLSHLRVPIKYIVTKSSKNANAIDRFFEGVKGTNNLNEVLQDPDIKGVFICASPRSHFSLIQQVLQAGKNVFVEKPPCQSTKELEALIQIEQASAGTCLVGLQKRYAPCYQILKKELKQVHSYNLRYLVGPYPEGDALTDLFIHPLDLIHFLFPKGEIESIQVSKHAASISLFLHLKHSSIIGNIELSTDYSWQQAQEEIQVNTGIGVFQSTNCERVTFTKKPGAIFSIPKEKLFPFQPQTTTLFFKNSFLPVLQQNELYTAGYFSEIEQFVKLCEGQKADNLSRLKDVQITFELIAAIKKQLLASS